MDGMRAGADERVMRMSVLACVLGLVVLSGSALGQTRQAGEPTDPPWFQVSWAPSDGVVSLIKGRVFNGSPYRVTDVRLRVEGFGEDRRVVGRILVWAFGDIAPGGDTSFVAEALPGAVSYRITVVAFDLVSVGDGRTVGP
jgi:hypothetical protein